MHRIRRAVRRPRTVNGAAISARIRCSIRPNCSRSLRRMTTSIAWSARCVSSSGGTTLERSVAIYVRSARTRGEPIETVLGTLQTVADDLERDAAPGFKQRDTPLRHVLLRGVLLAFYGADVVRREESARRDRAERRSADSESPSRNA